MTKKDYIALAVTFKSTKPALDCGQYTDRARQWWLDVQRIADTLQADNPCFDRAKFLTACGMN